MNQPQQPESRDYTAISPSAKSLVLLKGYTNIPFARKTAELISSPNKYNPDFNKKDLAFWKRVVHFENRYWSIDQLLSRISITNILELSSGYSFRGLETVMQNAVHYIDTDLPDLIAQKKDFIGALQGKDIHTKGILEMRPLNALDEKQFDEVVASFPEGPIAIVNEGLLMYLNNEEKQKLCKIIYKTLKRHGGYWITADIYVTTTLERLNEESDDSLKDLVEQQGIEKNMFESFEVAEEFFKKSGFVIDNEVEPDYSKLSSLQYLISNSTEAQLQELRNSPRKIQTSWCLKVGV